MAECGYSGTELGPYGYFPTDAQILLPVLRAKSLEMLSSFVPVNLADPAAAAEATEQIRKVGSLLAALGAPCVILADAQSKARENIAGRVPSDGSASLTAQQWGNVTRVAREAERIVSGFRTRSRISPARRDIHRDARRDGPFLRCCFGDPNGPLSRYRALSLRGRRPGGDRTSIQEPASIRTHQRHRRSPSSMSRIENS